MATNSKQTSRERRPRRSLHADVILRRVEKEIRWMRECAVRNTELALKPTFLKPQFNRGVAEGLRIAAQAMENAIKQYNEKLSNGGGVKQP